MAAIPSFDEYIDSLSQLTEHVDPTTDTATSLDIKTAAASLESLSVIDEPTLIDWVRQHPAWVPALGLTLGLSREKLQGYLKHALGTSGWTTLARKRPADLVAALDEMGLITLLSKQRGGTFGFGDLLVARAGSRAFAVRAGRAGRDLEDLLEDVARSVGLDYGTRTRFTGRNWRVA